ncbi:MAG: selenide, water dikinase SelD [Deltaproteobacteria bacterium GWA2_57_13]|nr:MAG: selenide, water dikinase SelD [Deltaproteobacteria bacterium GWA2_57_13]
MQVLHGLPKFDDADLIVGIETADDAGVFRLRPDLAVVNTVDFFPPIVDDPYTFGQVAAANAMSDIYAMGAEPKTALNIVCFPKGKMDIQVLGEILKGGAEKVREAGAVVVGGHSIIDEEIKYGMAITGVIHPDRIIRNVGVQEGDALILTKPLGTGIITTALKKGKAPKESIQAAISSMLSLNKIAAKIMRGYPVHACSDITGYGLMGHALEMASGSSVTLILESAKLPILHRAPRLAEKGYLTGGCKRNRDYLKDKTTIDKTIREGLVETALDPQTSGGLLIALAQKRAPRLVEELQDNGVKAAAVIGYATSLQKAWVRLV